MERTGFRVYHLWNAGEFIAYLSSHDFWVTEHTLLGGACTAFVLCGGQEVTAQNGSKAGHRRCMTVARLLIINECGLFV